MIRLMAFTAMITGMLFGCASWRTSELHTICVRTVDDLGFLRGRTAQYNDRGAGMALRGSARTRFSHRGECVDGAQGRAQRITVCLVASSACANDRTTNVWSDQKDWYFKKYPGSYEGRCTEEKVDECTRTLGVFQGILKPGCLQYDKQCKP